MKIEFFAPFRTFGLVALKSKIPIGSVLSFRHPTYFNYFHQYQVFCYQIRIVGGYRWQKWPLWGYHWTVRLRHQILQLQNIKSRSAGYRIHSANYCPSLIQIGWKKKLWRLYDQKGDPKCHNLFYANRLTFMYAEEIKHNIMKILRNHSNYPKKYLYVTIHSVIIIAIYLVVIRLLFVKLGFR